MAEFQNWQRQILPQERLVAPNVGPSMAEAFGEGVGNLVRTAGAVVDKLDQIEKVRAEKEWEIKQPEAAALVNTLQLNHVERGAELKAAAAAGLSDYPDKIDLDIRLATEDALKGIKDPRYQEYVRTRMDAFRTSAVGLGIQERTAATLQRDAGALQTLVDGQAKLVAADFAKYDGAAGLIDDTLATNRHFGADSKAELSTIGKRALAKAGLDALITHDPNAAEKVLASGKLDGVLTADDGQYYRATIKNEGALREREAILALQQQQEKLQADGAVAQERSLKDARETGKYDPKDRDVIIKAHPNDYPQIIAKLDEERSKGHDTFMIVRQTGAEDEALLRKTEAALSTKPHDKALTAQLLNIKEQLRVKQTALKSKPEAYVRQWVPELQKGWEEVEKNPADLNLLRRIKGLSRQAQLARGVQAKDVRVLPDSMVDLYLKVASGPDGVAAIAQLRDALGDDYNELLDQASRKEGPLMNVVLMLKRPEQRDAQRKLLEINREGGISALEALPNKHRPEYLRSLVDGELKELAPSFAEQYGGKRVLNQIRESVYALTLDSIARGIDPGEAAENAAQQIVTGFYVRQSYQGHDYRIPVGYNSGIIAEMLPKYLKDHIDYSRVDKPTNWPDITPEQIRSVIMSSAYWTVNGDESGLYLRDGSGGLITAGGKPITVTWDELKGLWRPPEPEGPIL